MTGVNNALILGNLEYLCENGAEVIIRVPIIPAGMTDSPSDIRAIGEYIRVNLHGRIRWIELLPYNKLAKSKYTKKTAWRDHAPLKYSPGELEQQSNEYVAELCGILQCEGLTCFAEPV